MAISHAKLFFANFLVSKKIFYKVRVLVVVVDFENLFATWALIAAN